MSEFAHRIYSQVLDHKKDPLTWLSFIVRKKKLKPFACIQCEACAKRDLEVDWVMEPEARKHDVYLHFFLCPTCRK